MDSAGCKGNTALHFAAENAEADVMEELIGQGLSVRLKNARWAKGFPISCLIFKPSGETAVHLASGARANHDDIRHVELLLVAGCNLKKERTNEGCTAVHYAAHSGTKEVGVPSVE